MYDTAPATVQSTLQVCHISEGSGCDIINQLTATARQPVCFAATATMSCSFAVPAKITRLRKGGELWLWTSPLLWLESLKNQFALAHVNVQHPSLHRNLSIALPYCGFAKAVKNPGYGKRATFYEARQLQAVNSSYSYAMSLAQNLRAASGQLHTAIAVTGLVSVYSSCTVWVRVMSHQLN